MTKDHLTLVHENKEIKNKFAKDLKVGDEIPTISDWASS